MPFASLRITSPQNRPVYLNGRYRNPTPIPSSGFITIPTGRCTVETLNDEGKVDFRKTVNAKDHDNLVIDLDPVVPPETVQ